jgi:hypothetical protein
VGLPVTLPVIENVPVGDGDGVLENVGVTVRVREGVRVAVVDCVTVGVVDVVCVTEPDGVTESEGE